MSTQKSFAVVLLGLIVCATGSVARAETSVTVAIPSTGGEASSGALASVDPTGGSLSASYPFDLPTARGDVQPSLGLSYSSSAGLREAGSGWGLNGLPVIERRHPSSARGAPTFIDPMDGPKGDRLYFGDTPLVPICVVGSGPCAPGPTGTDEDSLPQWANGWVYFRMEVDHSFARFFWSPDRRTFVVQYKSGETMELGGPRDDTTYEHGIWRDESARILRWNVVRRYDSHGTLNPIVYVWDLQDDSGLRYLTDIYDTPTNAKLKEYAHRTHLEWSEVGSRQWPSHSPHWFQVPRRHLTQVIVTSAPLTSTAREFVRRYTLQYHEDKVQTLLTSVQLEGRCGRSDQSGIAEATALAGPTLCPTLPPTSYFYPFAPAIDWHTQPAHLDSVDATAAGPTPNPDDGPVYMDVTNDGLPDFVVASKISGQPQTVYVAFLDSGRLKFRVEQMGLFGGLTPSFLKKQYVSNTIFGNFLDGRLDVIWHDPMNRAFSIFSPFPNAGGSPAWLWKELRSTEVLPPEFGVFVPDPPLATTPRLAYGDVNMDGINDIVATGDANYLSRRDADGSIHPFATVVPHPPEQVHYDVTGTPVCDFGHFGNDDLPSAWFVDPDTNIPHFVLADMNADGIEDRVKVVTGFEWRCAEHVGKVFPCIPDPDPECGCYATCDSCGNGRNVPGCARWEHKDAGVSVTVKLGHGDGTFDSFEYRSHLIDLNGNESIIPPVGDFKSLTDVNGDGFADIVMATDSAVAIMYGQPTLRDNTDPQAVSSGQETYFIVSPDAGPSVPDWDRKKCNVYVANVDGEGAADVAVLCPSGFRYKSFTAPAVRKLAEIRNGMGKKTTVTYGSSVDYPPKPGWRGSPQPMSMVKTIDTTNGLSGVKAEHHSVSYTYDNPVFDMLTARFVGFKDVTQSTLSVLTGVTSTHTRYAFLNCDDSLTSPCPRSVDRPTEAVRGLPYLIETSNNDRTFLKTEHVGYKVPTLFHGMDGRTVRFSYAAQTDTYLYDPTSFSRSTATTSLSTIDAPPQDGLFVPDPTPIRSAGAYEHVRTRQSVDNHGNPTEIWRDGRVGLDTPIHVVQQWQPHGPDNWWFRAVGMLVDDGNSNAAATTGMRLCATHYNVSAEPDNVKCWLAGTLPLERSHEDIAKAIAPAPANASSRGWITLATYKYDDYGHVTHFAGPNGQCMEAEYDPIFSHAQVSTTTHGGGVSAQSGCGDKVFKSVSVLDRGLEKITMAIAPTRAITQTVFDGFGRALQLSSPSDIPHVTSKFDYFESTTVQQIKTSTSVDGVNFSDAYVMLDGLGRSLLEFAPADPNAHDGGKWIVSGLPDYDELGRVRVTYQPGFYNSDPFSFSLSASTSSSPQNTFKYDAWGRTTEVLAADGTAISKTVYHALSIDGFDERQIALGMPPTKKFSDGHGRVWRIERQIGSGKGDVLRIDMTYLATGELASVDRYKIGSNDPHVVRTMQYDTFGRMVRNQEPNTSTTDPNTSHVKTWLYAYDDAGDVVGTSDARGCGKNLFYDAAQRLVAEDFSPCLDGQPDYTPVQVTPNGLVVSGDGTETYHVYDMPEAGEPDADFGGSWDNLRGRLVASYDRASHQRFAYDVRGRAIGLSKQIASPGTPDAALANRYATWWYHTRSAYDDADRVTSSTTGADAAELLVNNASRVSLTYSARSVVNQIDSSYGVLARAPQIDADGFIRQVEYGDIATTRAAFVPDARRRVKRAMLSRWLANPDNVTRQMLLADDTYQYQGGMLSGIHDGRLGREWPDGAKPVSSVIGYDEAGYLKSVQHKYDSLNGIDAFVPPMLAESQQGALGYTPFVKAVNRVQSQSFAYDWRGNLTQAVDDANVFWDRGFGNANYNDPAQSDPKPNQMYHAGGLAGGSVDIKYDHAGNVVDIIVLRDALQCANTGACSHRFRYDWDEVGRLTRARRWDFGRKGIDPHWDPFTPSYPGAPSQDPLADLAFAYDENDRRVLKTTDGTSTDAEIFGSLRLEHATYDSSARDYEHTATTESVYLAGGARLVYVPGQALRVFLEFGNHLDSTSIVIDKDTSELVERITYLAYGATESDYRPTKWNSFRERYRLTGKEEESDVGLTYFGARYYIASLGRWASADPLAIHGLGGDLNPYSYAHGSPLMFTDPFGLDDGSRERDRDDDGAVCTNCRYYRDGDATLYIPDGDLIHGRVDRSYYGFRDSPTDEEIQRYVDRRLQDDAQRAHRDVDDRFLELTGDDAPYQRKKRFEEAALVAGMSAIPPVGLAMDVVTVFDSNASTTSRVVSGVSAGVSVIPMIGAAKGMAKGLRGAARGVEATEGAVSAATAAARLANSQCFEAGTLVWTDQGPKPIETIQLGDVVIGRNESTGEISKRTVVQTFTKNADDLLEVEYVTEGSVQKLRATGGHRIWVEGKGWVEASQLVAGDALSTRGGAAIVRKVSATIPMTVPVYNFEVAEDHTYFVGLLGIWVHNACVLGRINALKLVIPADSERRITMAVGLVERPDGTRFMIVATSEEGVKITPLRGDAKALVASWDDAVPIPGAGHAEMDIVNYAKNNDLKLVQIGATRPVCRQCASGPNFIPFDTEIVTPIKTDAVH